MLILQKICEQDGLELTSKELDRGFIYLSLVNEHKEHRHVSSKKFADSVAIWINKMLDALRVAQ